MPEENLTLKKCAPCEGGVDPLTREQFEPYLEQVAKWDFLDDIKMERNFVFNDFVEALDFVNCVGEIAEDEGHHPDILVHGWNNVKISLWTHAINGLSINDFILATKIDKIPFAR
jgi:4a-hydroxytetrahydrobiopterin dehydratase